MGRVYTHKDLIKIAESGGWVFVRTTGSHFIYRHPVKPGIVVIPVHNRDMTKGTANSILKQTGFKKEAAS